MKKFQKFLDYSKKNWQTIVIIVLVLYIAQKDFKIFSLLFSFLPLKIEVSNEAPKSTDWLQSIWWIASAIIAYFVYFITKRFNVFSEQQNKISLEEFRPAIIPEKDNWNLVLINKWLNDAVELSYYISTRNRDWIILELKKIAENLIIPPNWKNKIVISNWWYHSIIYKYKNSISWIWYFWWFNRYDWNNFLAIWEEQGNYKSSLKKETFQKSYDLLSVKKQIINNINFEDSFKDFLKSPWYNINY